MFYECRGLRALDLTSFETSNVTKFDYMFYNDVNLQKIYVSDNFIVKDGSSSIGMFVSIPKIV
jgi:surface protein